MYTLAEYDERLDDIWRIYYEGWPYVYDEDSYLAGVHSADHYAHSGGFTWKDTEQELFIRYGDSGSCTIPMSALICRDYQVFKY